MDSEVGCIAECRGLKILWNDGSSIHNGYAVTVVAGVCATGLVGYRRTAGANYLVSDIEEMTTRHKYVRRSCNMNNSRSVLARAVALYGAPINALANHEDHPSLAKERVPHELNTGSVKNRRVCLDCNVKAVER